MGPRKIVPKVSTQFKQKRENNSPLKKGEQEKLARDPTPAPVPFSYLFGTRDGTKERRTELLSARWDVKISR
ncbi:hypothetical protein M8J75_015996 [Diaphorina citri]|nr:hypothetical protein M8J75_015996 [Diaphorina citri]